MLPAGQKRQNEHIDQDESEDDETKPSKRNGRRKIKIEYIEDKNKRHITFSKRKSGIMKKAYELSTLTGTQVLLLVVSETGLVYTFTTTKLQPIVTKPEGKNLIQACLNTPDPAVPEMESDTKLEKENNFNEPTSSSSSSTTNVPVLNRVHEDTKNHQLSPQPTASSHSPMIQQTSPNTTAIRSNMVPTSTNTSNMHINQATVNYSQPQPQITMPPYNQHRYHPGYGNNTMPQPSFPSYPSNNNAPQQPSYYQTASQQQQSYGSISQQPPSSLGGYWPYNNPQQQQQQPPSNNNTILNPSPAHPLKQDRS
ncbi:uncharacterized protein BX663DRAFT_506883 [Cokeromyces recurvatus]|uniref:uncharacterized protein n=1 Tax=Cokeromyces recurvatus TaxID=90255 RepID=UPI0022203684|nr:uncharacterized protein BX663DRAFT_506883 [Cokeromyces recurvatus]KAI7903555.1 hypothetical protein BX663DRAFT_506883 [Cokeromyces recurvatus]